MTYKAEKPDQNVPTWLYYRRLALNTQHALDAANEALEHREARIRELEEQLTNVRAIVAARVA